MIVEESGWAWEILDIEVSTDERAIKRAYSRLLKLNRPDDDPEAFQQLHQAYQAALGYARYNAEAAGPSDDHAWPAEPPVPAPAPGRPADLMAVRPDPEQEAHVLWHAFLAQSSSAPRARLKTVDQSDAMLGFATRDAFELLALRHCADPECDETVRGALVDHFDWVQDASHVAKLDPLAAQDAVGRYLATNSHDQLRRDIHNYGVAKFLLASSIPENLGRTGDASFIRQMKQQIDLLRWHHRELLEYSVDPDVFVWWEQKVATKRYFVQTAMWSLIIGVASFFALRSALDLDEPLWAIGALFAGCQAVSFGAIALFVLRPPQGFYASLARFKLAHVDVWLHEKRYLNRWQFGWLAPFACLSLLMLVPEIGGAGRIALTGGLLLCAAASVFAGSLFFGKGRMFVALVLASINAFLMLAAGFESAGYACCLFFSIALFVLVLQYGNHLYSTAGITRGTLAGARVAWMAAAVALYFSIDLFQLSALATAIAAMSLLLCGVVLARFVAGSYLVWPALIGLKVLAVRPNALLGGLPHSQLRYLGSALIIVFMLMILNMFQSFSKAE